MENATFTWHPLDGLTRDLTAFSTFSELVNSAPQYRPTLLPRDRKSIDLADGYDAFQAARGDERRAWRGGGARIAPLDLATFVPGYNTLQVTLAGVPAGSGLASEWQRTIWTINRRARDEYGEEQIIATPTRSYEVDQTDSPYALHAYVEEYPEFRVVLHYTEWGHHRNFAIIEALTNRAAKLLRDAVADPSDERR